MSLDLLEIPTFRGYQISWIGSSVPCWSFLDLVEYFEFSAAVGLQDLKQASGLIAAPVIAASTSSILLNGDLQILSVAMSCGCGCCPKCGCRATCTCNNNLWSLESQSDFSYMNSRPMKTVADELEAQYSFSGDTEYVLQADLSGVEGTYAKKGSRGTTNVGAAHGCSAGNPE